MEDVGQGFFLPTSAWTASIRWDSFGLIESSARDGGRQRYKERGDLHRQSKRGIEVHVAWCEDMISV